MEDYSQDSYYNFEVENDYGYVVFEDFETKLVHSDTEDEREYEDDDSFFQFVTNIYYDLKDVVPYSGILSKINLGDLYDYIEQDLDEELYIKLNKKEFHYKLKYIEELEYMYKYIQNKYMDSKGNPDHFDKFCKFAYIVK